MAFNDPENNHNICIRRDSTAVVFPLNIQYLTVRIVRPEERVIGQLQFRTVSLRRNQQTQNRTLVSAASTEYSVPIVIGYGPYRGCKLFWSQKAPIKAWDAKKQPQLYGVL